MDFTPYGRKIVNVFQKIDKIYEMFWTFILEKVEVWAAGHIVLWTCLRYWGTPRLNTSMIFLNIFTIRVDNFRNFTMIYERKQMRMTQGIDQTWRSKIRARKPGEVWIQKFRGNCILISEAEVRTEKANILLCVNNHHCECQNIIVIALSKCWKEYGTELTL